MTGKNNDSINYDRLRDILARWTDRKFDFFDCVVHREAPDRCIQISALFELTSVGREDFSALLDARVEKVRRLRSGNGDLRSGAAGTGAVQGSL